MVNTMNLFKRIALAALLFAVCVPASAQWQVPDHAVPIGRGGGNTGFKNAAPGIIDLPLLSGGPLADPSFRALTNGSFGSSIPASTYKCNPTGGLGPLQDCAIPASGGGTVTGAACNATPITSAVTIGAGSPNLLVAGANFQVSDVGKVISVPGAGPVVSSVAGTLITTILSRTDATHVVLNANATTALAAVSKTVVYGTDDTAAFQTVLSDSTTGIVNFSSPTGCMITDTLTISAAKTLTANQVRSKLYYRQLAGTTVKALLSAAVDGVVLDSFGIDFDAGAGATSATKVSLIAAGNHRITINRLDVAGNRDIQSLPTTAGVGNIGSGSIVSNSKFSDIASIPVQGGCGQSRIQIYGNRIERGPTLTNGTGFISFLCAGTSAVMTDIRVHDNSIDMSDLSVANMNVGIYFFGGNASAAYYYTQLTINSNSIVGTPGATASNTGGIILINVADVAVTGNVIMRAGECIGSGANQATISGNTLIGCGTYGIELSGAGVTVTGNTIDTETQSTFGMSIGNCQTCVINGNVISGASGPAGFTGIFSYATNGGTSTNVNINNNMVTLPAAGTTYGIRIFGTAGAVSLFDYNVVGNHVATGGAASTGIQLAGTATNQFAFLVGPNTTAQNVGVDASAGFAAFCYVKGVNRSSTLTTGAAFPGACN
jgi:hypothetical protein